MASNKINATLHDDTQISDEENGDFDRSWRDEKLDGISISEAAGRKAQDQSEMTIREALQNYRPGLLWCLTIQMVVIMEGYDTNLMSNFFAFPSFQIRFGEYVGESQQTPSGFQLTPAWMAGISQSAGVGTFFGVLLNGYLVAKYGARKVLIVALFFTSAFQFIPFFAPSPGVLVAGQVLNGFPWGVFATCAPAYASEVLPKQLRTYMTSYTNMCFIIGQLISAGVLKGFSTSYSPWAYRIPIALQWIWPIFLIPAIYFGPESPWYLVRMGRMEEAEASLRRLQSKSATHIDPKITLSEIIYTNNLEEQLSIGTSYWDCFKGFELRRTEIACMCFAGQILSGIVFAYNSSYFFEAVGLGTSTTYSLALGGTALALVGTVLNWVCFMPYFGRRTIYTVGMACMTVILMIVGILNIWTDRPGVGMAQAVLTLLWTFIFQLSAGQLGWALPAEIGSTRLRQKTICLARNASSLCGVIAGVLHQYMMNSNTAAGGWNIRGYAGFVWGSTAALMTVWAYFRLPETWNRSFHELDILFAKKVSARKFATTKVNAFDEHDNNQLAEKYSGADVNRRPSYVPSITQRIHDPVDIAQRRASTVGAGEKRKPSISQEVTGYLESQGDGVGNKQ